MMYSGRPIEHAGCIMPSVIDKNMIMSGMLLLFLALVAHTNGENIVCYYTNWSQYTPAPYKYTAYNVDARLCTHVVFAFCAPRGVEVVTKQWNDDQMFRRLNQVQTENPKMKTLLAVGGPRVGREPFVTLSSKETNRVLFANNVITFVRKYKLDGFELAWQYPQAADKENYAELVEALRSAFEAEAISSGKPRLLLSASLPAKRALINAGLDIPGLAGNLDMFNIMTFDFAEDWEPLTVFNAPLYASPNGTESRAVLNVDWVAKYYVARGAPKTKMNIGISSYGRSFTLSNPKASGLKSPVIGAGIWNKYSGKQGRMSYHEICNFIKGGGKVTRVESQGNPYVVRYDQWVGYEDPISVTQKAKYIKVNRYGGALFWTLDYDDFLGKSCNNGKYPLLRAINDAFQNELMPVQLTSKPLPVQLTSKPLPVTPPPNEETTIQRDADYNYNILCYFTNWAQYRNGMGKFLPGDVDPMLCTHITYAFCKIVGLNLARFEHNDVQMYKRINDLKLLNPKLKTLLSVGGASMGSYPFIEVSRNDINRNTFAKNVISYVRQHKFDGFEVDWEFPGAGERKHFALFIQKLRYSFDEEAKTFGRPRLQLGIATSAGKWVIDAGLDVPNVAPFVDFMNVMTYDYFGPWSDTIGFNSALYAHPDQSDGDKNLNVRWSAKYIESLGAPKEKINIGIATYGRSFTLRDEKMHYGVMSPHNGPGNPLPFSGTPGIAFYYEICEIINAGGKVVRVESQGNPYVIKGKQWIGYDDVESVTKKAQYVKNNNYAGVIIWTMGDDDFSGEFCQQGKYPLIKAISNTLSSRFRSMLASAADEESDAVDAHNAISTTWIVTLLIALLG